MSIVLVTGGSGFLGSRCVLQLIEEGHDVRMTIRSRDREQGVRAMLGDAGAASIGFHVTDLRSDDGWTDAVEGCDFVLHVASPFPARQPKDEKELIGPARDGTLRVLRAARDAGVRRVVMTSSFAAIGYGRAEKTTPYTEEDWTDVGAQNPPYIKSKAIAERAAWDFVARSAPALELSVINPTGIFGPVLGGDHSASIGIIAAMLGGALPGLPDVYFGVVDVRDVADLHLRAMLHPEAAGERFIAVAGPSVSMSDVAQMLRANLGSSAAQVPTRKLPSWQIRLLALVSAQARATVPNLGKRRIACGEKARRILGWSPRSSEEAILATARSLLALRTDA